MTDKKYNMTASTATFMWKSDDPPATTEVEVCKEEKKCHGEVVVGGEGENKLCVPEY